MSNIEYALNGGLSFQPVACKAKSFWKKGWDLKKCFFNGSPSPTKSCGTSSQHYNTPRSSLSSLVSCSGHAPWVSYHCTFPQYVLFMEVFFPSTPDPNLAHCFAYWNTVFQGLLHITCSDKPLGPSLCYRLTSMMVPFPFIAITWYLFCVLPVIN